MFLVIKLYVNFYQLPCLIAAEFWLAKSQAVYFYSKKVTVILKLEVKIIVFCQLAG